MPFWGRKNKSYDVIIVLYDTIRENEYGVSHYETELYKNPTALSLSPNSKWRDVETEVWKRITGVYRSIGYVEKDDYSVNMSMSYNLRDSQKRRAVSYHANDRAFFGLLGRNSLTDLELRINVTYSSKPLREHLEEVKARKELEESSRDSQESVEDLEVEKSETTVSVNEVKTRSCTNK
ncbi:hypothetical protein KCU81_g1153, partial [Aureobasidium melanogenum]|uniref:Uncharacterized protein n=1 Tax=Aureobasidium melanogenum (strain CBS 110374) TaxID=1043003 RepID=A0A074WWB0_AURM1